ncbi:MAG: ATP synthase F1 subunit gamma [Candidatus Saccharimonadales bacterium]|nr:ATP synthase F1 subunit gamma [Candidatus Saccharimonadales bacterium]
MASTQQIKRRIKSVRSTKQITKAMELVAASKMRKAQEATLRSRAYRNTAREILTRLRKTTDVSTFELYNQRIVKSRLQILITSDRGLAGAYNSNMLKEFAKNLQQDEKNDIESHVLLVGRQGANFSAKLKGIKVVGVYENFPDQPSANDLKPILDTMTNMFLDGTVDRADVFFTDFVSSLSQHPAIQTLLPVAFEEAESPGDLADVVFEPSPERVLKTITPRLLEVQLLQAMLESSASEHSMRMMAMKSASDNATDLIDDLTLEFNSARQAAITQELAEITGGAEAIS